MNIMLLGAAGFIGINLTIRLATKTKDHITLVDQSRSYFAPIESMKFPNVCIREAEFNIHTDFEALLEEQEVVYHLFSTTAPTTSNQRIAEELSANVIITAYLLEAAVKCGVKKFVFISSGGTVYGKIGNCPLNETAETNPISAYGLQKITIEKLLYLYQYLYAFDYRVIRLSNPYGPYQRPNGRLGVITTFIYKALRNEELMLYGDGSVVRDFIFIDDAIRGILNIANGTDSQRVFNLGSGSGTSINEVLHIIEETLQVEMRIHHKPGRMVDVPVNFLDISRYENLYGKLNPIPLRIGIQKTTEFLRKYYCIR